METNDTSQQQTSKNAGATTRKRPRRDVQPETTSEMDLMLALVSNDNVEVETPPDFAKMSMIEAAVARSEYYARLAQTLAQSEAARRERTRGLIIIGALAAELPSTARALFAEKFAALKPADKLCVRSIEWARKMLDTVNVAK